MAGGIIYAGMWKAAYPVSSGRVAGHPVQVLQYADFRAKARKLSDG